MQSRQSSGPYKVWSVLEEVIVSVNVTSGLGGHGEECHSWAPLGHGETDQPRLWTNETVCV